MGVKHGQYGSVEYQTWADMKVRCLNPNNKRYADYGGRGITVCKRWLSFENFLADMGTRPSNQHSLDRIDNDKGYFKENCRWATRQEQNGNRRRRRDARLYQGKTVAQWAVFWRVPYMQAYDRLRAGRADKRAQHRQAQIHQGPVG